MAFESADAFNISREKSGAGTFELEVQLARDEIASERFTVSCLVFLLLFLFLFRRVKVLVITISAGDLST